MKPFQPGLVNQIFSDLRARLEMAVDHVTEACSEVECLTDTDCTSVMSESDSQPEYLMSSPRVASIVRKELAIAIRDLMQHGLVTVSESKMLLKCLHKFREPNCTFTIFS